MISDFWWHLQTLIYEPRHDKTNKMSVRLAKIQISLGICPVWSESSLCAQWVAKSQSYHHADSDDSDQAGRMPRLIWVYTGHFVGFVMSRLIFTYLELDDFLCWSFQTCQNLWS